MLNQILDSKVAITSDRPQTTRNAIRGIRTTQQAQLIFVDTPGLHKPQSALGISLNRVVRRTLGEVDVVVFLVDALEGVGAGDAFIVNELKQRGTPVVVVLNKIDVSSPAQLETARRRVTEVCDWIPFGVSAKTGAGVDDLVTHISGLLPEGPLYYPPDSVTDQPERQIVAELIREKVLRRMREEVPHSVAVVVEDIESVDDRFEISATIYVERDSQKGIVIGKGGRVLKDVGTEARREIETLLGRHVYIDLRVKVEADWQRRDALIARFGYGE